MSQRITSKNQLYKGLVIGFTLVLMVVAGVLGTELAKRNQALRQRAQTAECATRGHTCCNSQQCNWAIARRDGSDDTNHNYGCGDENFCCYLVNPNDTRSPCMSGAISTPTPTQGPSSTPTATATPGGATSTPTATATPGSGNSPTPTVECNTRGHICCNECNWTLGAHRDGTDNTNHNYGCGDPRMCCYYYSTDANRDKSPCMEGAGTTSTPTLTPTPTSNIPCASVTPIGGSGACYGQCSAGNVCVNNSGTCSCVTPSPTPTKIPCNQSCGINPGLGDNLECQTNYCYTLPTTTPGQTIKKCRKSDCPTQTNCTCSGPGPSNTPTPTATPSAGSGPTATPTPTGSPGATSTPTPTPTGGAGGLSLSVAARFQGFDADNQPKVLLTVEAKGTSFAKSFILPESGVLENLDLTGLEVSQTYDLIFSSWGFLSIKKNVTLISGRNPSIGNLLLGTFRSGDLNGDNQVNGLDWSLMKTHYGESSE